MEGLSRLQPCSPPLLQPRDVCKALLSNPLETPTLWVVPLYTFLKVIVTNFWVRLASNKASAYSRKEATTECLRGWQSEEKWRPKTSPSSPRAGSCCCCQTQSAHHSGACTSFSLSLFHRPRQLLVHPLPAPQCEFSPPGAHTTRLAKVEGNSRGDFSLHPY